MSFDPAELERLRVENAALRDRVKDAAKAEQRLALAHEVARRLARSTDAGDAIDGVLRASREGLRMDACACWLPDERGETVRCTRTVAADDAPDVERFAAANRGRSFGPGVGLPGRVWQAGRALWVESVADDPNFPRADAATAAGLQTGIATPIVGDGRCLGVIEWFARERLPRDGALLAVMESIGADVGQLLLRIRDERRLDEQRRLLASVTDNATRALFLMDDRQECVFMNPAAERMTGFSIDAVRGRPLHDVIHHTRPDGSHFPLSECPIDRAFPANDREQGEEVFVHRDGHFYDVEFTASPIRDDAGRAVGTIIEVADVTERKRAEAALRASEDRFRKIFEHAATGIAITDWEGRFLQCNAAYAAILGYREDELRRLGFAELVHPEDRAANLAELRRLMDEELPFFEIENRYVRKGGEPVWVHKFVSLLRDDKGQPAYLVALVTDVTERHHAERNLAFLADLSAAFPPLASAGDVAETAAQQVAAHFGAAGARICDADEPALAELGEAIVADLRAGRVVAVDDVAADPRTAPRAASFAARGVAALLLAPCASDGRLSLLLAVHDAAPRRWRADEAVLVQQVTARVQPRLERARAEEALRESEQRYRAIFENAAAGVVLVAPDRRLLRVNDTFCRITGYTREELLGRSVDAITHPDDVLRQQPQVNHLLTGEIDQYAAEKRYVRKDGSVVWVSISAASERDPSGAPLHQIAVVTDVTDRKRVEEALRQADLRKDEFLAMLGHELRNPLAPIRNAVEIMRLVGPKDPTLDGARDMIERQVDHMARLLDDLLDVSRVSRNRIALQKTRIDLATVVRQAVETSRPAIEARRQRIEVTVPAETLPVEGDFARLVQVVGNLLHNAIKYTDAGGQIAISLEREAGPDGAAAVLRVRDSGRGIDPEALGSVFDLFYQVDRNLDRSDGGLGIGLSLVKSLVEMHGGRVEAHSAGRGRGSEFVVRLPCLEPGPAPAATRERTPPAKSARCLRVLVVDDLRDSAESMAALLEIDGHAVSVAHDGDEAVAKALAERPDVVLLDIGLPKQNGYEACRAMRKAGLERTLVVAMTGYGQDADRRASHDAGFDAHLVKPVDLATIRELLARHAART